MEEGGWGAGRYHVEGPAALPDAVRVEHVEDAAADPRVCTREASFLGPAAPAEGARAFGGHPCARPHLIPHPGRPPGPVRGQTQGRPTAPHPGGPIPAPALTQLPAAHVIELDAEEQGGDNVDD